MEYVTLRVFADAGWRRAGRIRRVADLVRVPPAAFGCAQSRTDTRRRAVRQPIRIGALRVIRSRGIVTRYIRVIRTSDILAGFA